MHFRGLFADEVFEKLAYADFNSHLAAVDHMLGQMSQEHVVVLLLKLTCQESPHVLVVYVVLQEQQIVENLNGVGFQKVNLCHPEILVRTRVFQVFSRYVYWRIYTLALRFFRFALPRWL